MNKKSFQTIVETPEFIRQSHACFDEDSKNDFIEFIAKNPPEGELISGTGGARKFAGKARPIKEKGAEQE